MTMPTGLVKSTIQASGSAALRYPLGDVEHDRNGPQRLGEPAGAGGLLAEQAELAGQRLVDQAGLLAADAQLDEHRRCAVDGLVERRRWCVAGRRSPARPRMRRARPPTTSRRSARDVVQDELVARTARRPPGESLDQLGRVRAPAADDCDLHRCPPTAVRTARRRRGRRRRWPGRQLARLRRLRRRTARSASGQRQRNRHPGPGSITFGGSPRVGDRGRTSAAYADRARPTAAVGCTGASGRRAPPRSARTRRCARRT